MASDAAAATSVSIPLLGVGWRGDLMTAVGGCCAAAAAKALLTAAAPRERRAYSCVFGGDSASALSARSMLRRPNPSACHGTALLRTLLTSA